MKDGRPDTGMPGKNKGSGTEYGGYGEIEKKAGSGFFWKMMENGGAQGVQFLISLILARLLSPAEYGTLAMMSVLVSIANVLIQNGFATALIQKEEADALDFSSVLCFSLFLSFAIYVLLFLAAPAFSLFFEDADLTPLIRVLLLVLFPGAVIAVQHAYIARNLAFRSLFEATLAASLLSGAVSIFMAYRGLKVWSLVGQQLVYYFSLMGILLFRIKGFAAKAFRPERIRNLFRFGSKILAASLIDTLFTNLHNLAIGKVFSQETLGSFYRGEQFPKLVTGNYAAVVQSVILPLMSARQGDKGGLRTLLSSTLRVSAYIVFPLMGGMAAAADRIILVLLGKQWESAIFFLVLTAVSYGMWPLHICNLQAIAAQGRSDVFLRLEVVKKLLGLFVLGIGLCLGMFWLVLLKAAAEFIGIFINARPNKGLLSYGAFEQLRDVAPSFFLTAVMAAGVWGIGRRLPYTFSALLLQVLAGAVIYIVFSILFRVREWDFLWERFKEFLKSGKEGQI